MTKVRHRIYREDFRNACVLLREMTDIIGRLDRRLRTSSCRDSYLESIDDHDVNYVENRAREILGQAVLNPNQTVADGLGQAVLNPNQTAKPDLGQAVLPLLGTGCVDGK